MIKRSVCWNCNLKPLSTIPTLLAGFVLGSQSSNPWPHSQNNQPAAETVCLQQKSPSIFNLGILVFF